MKYCILFLSIIFFCSCQVNQVTEKPVAEQSSKRRILMPSRSFTKEYMKVGSIFGPAGSPEEANATNRRKAKTLLLEMLEKCKDRCKRYEYASVYNFLAWVNNLEGDNANALKYYNLVLQQTPEIPLFMELQTLSMISSLHFALDNYDKAEEYLKRMETLDPRAIRSNCIPTAKLLILKKEYLTALQKLDQCISHAESTRPFQLAYSDIYKTKLDLMKTLGQQENTGIIEDKYQQALKVENQFQPNVTVAPIYPQDAINNRVEGYCTLEYTVTKVGDTKNIRAVDCPNKMFLAESIKAASKFKYKPKMVNDQPVNIEQVQYRFVFKIKGG